MNNTKHLYRLRNVFDGESVEWTLDDFLREINRDRSDDWRDYDESDWQEGLEVFTEWELIAAE
jgi:hypothetical protein